jgi:hypothetical protein
MEIKAIALTLPNPQKLLVLTHKRASTNSPLVWDPGYRDQLFEMQRFVREVAKGKHWGELTEEQKEALYVPGMTPKQADQAIECVSVDAERYSKKIKFLDRRGDSVVEVAKVGYDVEGGMRRYVLVNNGAGFTPSKGLLEEIDRVIRGQWSAVSPQGKQVPLSRFEPRFSVVDLKGVPVDFDALEFRCRHQVIGQIKRFKGKALTEDKEVRLVTVPFEVKASIVVSRGKEVLREIPRQWA